MTTFYPADAILNSDGVGARVSLGLPETVLCGECGDGFSNADVSACTVHEPTRSALFFCPRCSALGPDQLTNALAAMARLP